MEITRKTGYAVRALVELAMHPEGYTSSKIIAEKQEIPVNFLPQIVALLGSQGWVAGRRGPGGGIRLKVDPATITIENVMELTQGKIAISPCLSGECSRSYSCPLKPVWNRAQSAFLAVLNQTTIADLANHTP
ncbi:MAG: Rrf2 family transcriptional regulator [Firmicutes bacterium]|nr:Rrf2 family transcriptional regulator [Bacillota bacterium]